MCDYWYQDDVKEKCQKKKESRGLMRNPHNQGPIAFVSLHEELLAREDSGVKNKMDFWKYTRTTRTGEWLTEESRKTYEEMIEKFDASKDTEHPMTEDEAFHAVLGYTSGYCVGLGYGPKPPSMKRDCVNAECAKLREINIKFTEDNEKLQKRCDHLEENLTI
ncbi:hypothetical protein LINPERPRIM_LOCUS31348 [Linum perenne]